MLKPSKFGMKISCMRIIIPARLFSGSIYELRKYPQFFNKILENGLILIIFFN